MLSALFNAAIGILSGLLVGMGLLEFSAGQVFFCLVLSQVMGVIALLGTLQAERIVWIRRHVLNRSFRTWGLFLGVYFGGMLLFARPLRDPKALAWMAIPLAMSNGIAILIFGPIQDRIVRREQRRVQLAAANQN